MKQVISDAFLEGQLVTEKLRKAHLFRLYNFFYSIKFAKGIIYIAKRIGLGRWWIISELDSLGEKSKPVYSKAIDYKYCMSDAERADVDGDYSKAISLYLDTIEKERMDLEDYLNLVHLLWRCTLDSPLISPKSNLPVKPDFDAHDKMVSILKHCSEEYAGCSDVDFWDEYYRVSGNWKAHTEEEWRSIIFKYECYFPHTEQMFFVCYLHNADNYSRIIDSFYTECDRCPTALNLYIKNMIEQASCER